ncbi:MAG: hypothetical protein WC343_01100 [Bacilli bacterium]|jgi:hypothetical protein
MQAIHGSFEGGNYNNGANAGAWNFNNNSGGVNSNISFRVVLGDLGNMFSLSRIIVYGHYRVVFTYEV